MRHFYYKTFLLLGIVTLFSSYSFSQTYESIPYYNGFESGTLGPEWVATSSLTTGEIDVFASGFFTWNTSSADAYAGTYFLGMHNAQPAGSYNLNSADLHLDASGQSGLYLSFWWAEWNEETEPEDGIYISDNGGTSFIKVLDFDGASTADLVWQFYNFNLDSINNQHGLSYSNQYIIRLQQYDNYYFAGGNDGMLFDEINVYKPCFTTSSITEVVCSSYTVPSGDETYISSGVYLDTIPNNAGCDSIITVNLTVNQTTSSITETVCDSYTVPSGDETYTTSGTYNDTLTNAANCDSIITINLTVYQSATNSLTVTECGSYESDQGNVYTTSGTYNETFQTVNGCDSVVTINLTILDVPSMSISSTNGVELTAVGNADSLSWIDCNNMIVVSPMGSNYTPNSNGDYAVVGVNFNGCVDTSACYSVQSVSVDNHELKDVTLYPNPSNEMINLIIPFQYERIQVLDVSGRIIIESRLKNINVSMLKRGTYFVRIISESQQDLKTLNFIKL